MWRIGAGFMVVMSCSCPHWLGCAGGGVGGGAMGGEGRSSSRGRGVRCGGGLAAVPAAEPVIVHCGVVKKRAAAASHRYPPHLVRDRPVGELAPTALAVVNT